MAPRPTVQAAGAWPAALAAIALGVLGASWGWLLQLPLDVVASVLRSTPLRPGAELIEAVTVTGMHGLWMAPVGFVATQWLVRGWRGVPWLLATMVLIGVAVLVAGSGLILGRYLLHSGGQGPADVSKLLAIVTAFLVLPAAYGWAAAALADGVVGVRFRRHHALGGMLAGIGTVWGCSWLTVALYAWASGTSTPGAVPLAMLILALGYAAHAALWRPR